MRKNPGRYTVDRQTHLIDKKELNVPNISWNEVGVRRYLRNIQGIYHACASVQPTSSTLTL
jgi:imidazoleglycerol phosphate synthase glutamine amidotransferase subunit HisH